MRIIMSILSWIIVASVINYYNQQLMNQQHSVKQYSIGLLVVATGKYIDFIPPLIESARKYFLSQHNVTFFIFTDGTLPKQDDVVIIPHQRQGWPYDTLMRFHVYYKHSKQFAHCNYLFSCDADMLFADYVGDEILGDRVATQHSNYLFDIPPYETNPFSTACIHAGRGKYYFAGAFYGGIQDEFKKLLYTIKNNINTDLARGIIARVNDESYLNKYFTEYKPTVVLSPSYCHFVHWQSPYQRKLLAIDDKASTIRPQATKNPLRYAQSLSDTKNFINV